MARHAGTTLTLITLHICGLCVHASSGENVNCWWNKVVLVGQSVSIECQAQLQSPMLKCAQCHLHLKTPQRAVEARPHQCTQLNAYFSVLLEPQAMQDAHCLLTCPGEDPAECSIKEGFPPPTCLIPWDDEERKILCHWTWTPDHLNTTNFTLHLKEEGIDGNSAQIEVANSDRAIFPRSDYAAYNSITVWLTVQNWQGFVQSDTATYHTGNIQQFDPPFNLNHTFNPLEISWQFLPSSLEIDQQLCQVQYRKECDPDWTENKDFYDLTFFLDDALPFTIYNFRIRCGVGSPEERVVMSEWSPVHTVQTPAAAPVGKLDVWSDCEVNSETPNCQILWKAKARGQISSYVVTVKLNDSLELQKANSSSSMCSYCGEGEDGSGPASGVSAEGKCGRRWLQCSHRLVDAGQVQSVYVTEYTSEGASDPAFVALPRPGAQTGGVQMTVNGTSAELKVSWTMPSQSEHVQEVVVQLKSVGSARGDCLNWVKVDSTCRSVSLTGGLRNYTAYNVSLFAVMNNSSSLLKSDVAYTVQGVPPKVADFQVTYETASSVKVTWTPIPLNESRGEVLHYVVGYTSHKRAYNVSHSSSSSSLVLHDLSPGEQYEFWIRAVTSAGEGESTTTPFVIGPSPFSGRSSGMAVVAVVVFVMFVSLIIILLWWLFAQPKVNECLFRIPDPINSRLFQQKADEFRPSWPDHEVSTENSLMISPIELFHPEDGSEQQEEKLESEQICKFPEEDKVEEKTTGQREDGGKERRESERSEGVGSGTMDRRKDYSQVIDSTDEENSSGNDEKQEEEEEEEEEWGMTPYPSDYERHFWPPTVEA